MRKILVAALLVWSVFMPESSFPQTVENIPASIQSPKDIVKWFKNEFKYELKFPDSRQSAEETIRLKKGDCEDFALLGRMILGDLGIKSSIVIIKFKEIGIYHAICLFTSNGFYSFISNRDLVRTSSQSIEGAVNEKFPDWEKIVFLNEDGGYGNVIERRYSSRPETYNLASPSHYGDIMGAEYRDMGMIRMALQQQLASLSAAALPVNIGTFMTILGKRQIYKNRNILSDRIQFLFRDIELISGGFHIICKVKDRYGIRNYHAVFSLAKNGDGGFSVMVCPEKEWGMISAHPKAAHYAASPEDSSIEKNMHYNINTGPDRPSRFFKFSDFDMRIFPSIEIHSREPDGYKISHYQKENMI